MLAILPMIIKLKTRKGITITISELKMIMSATNALFQPFFTDRNRKTGRKIVNSTIAPNMALNNPLNAYNKKQPSIIILTNMMLLRCL